jgi:hypothetical protein
MAMLDRVKQFFKNMAAEEPDIAAPIREQLLREVEELEERQRLKEQRKAASDLIIPLYKENSSPGMILTLTDNEEHVYNLLVVGEDKAEGLADFADGKGFDISVFEKNLVGMKARITSWNDVIESIEDRGRSRYMPDSYVVARSPGSLIEIEEPEAEISAEVKEEEDIVNAMREGH